MSRTDKLGRNTARRINSTRIAGVYVAAKPRNALLPTATEAIAEQRNDTRAKAREIARNLPKRPFPTSHTTETARPVARPVARVQMVTDNRRYVASQGRLPHVGAHTAGKHTANLDAGMVATPLHVMAKRRLSA